MATVLYWNINNFTDNRVSLRKKRTYDEAEYGTGPPGPEHLQLIMDTFNSNIDPNTNNSQTPDFIVIVEVYSRIGAPNEGDLIDGTGKDGCLRLRRRLGANWALVPPIVTGTDGAREAIAVFYRRDRWYFLGPEAWPNNYPNEFNRGLPNRTIPAGYPYRANQPERRSAGQFHFETWTPGVVPDHNAALVQFPGAGNRQPWLTAFGRVGNNNLLVRLMGIHTKPNELTGARINYADQATANLANVYTMTAEPVAAANQIDVILGDFNVSNTNQAHFQAGGPFGRLVGQGVNPVNPPYAPLLRSPAGLQVNYESYYHTHGRQRGYATILDDDEQPDGFYPGYRYTDLSIDNVLVRYRGFMPPAASHLTIVNRVIDTPYAAPAPPPPPPNPQPYLGYYENVFAMEQSIPNIFALAPDPYEDLNQLFRSANNYDLVFRVSDHFALMFDI